MKEHLWIERILVHWIENETSELQQLVDTTERENRTLSHELIDAKKTIERLMVEKAELEQ